jgi:hypothetical protein
MDYFENKNIEEEERRNTALQIVGTLREAINLGKKEQNPITYEKTLDILSEVKPSFYNPIIKLLSNKNESDLVKLYKELAEAQSTETNKITPVDLINEELHKMEALSERNGDKKFIRKKVVDLKAAKEYFMPRKVSEHKALNQDFFLSDRGDYFSKKIYENDSYKDYRLDNNRVLRLRLLHPDKEEAILGSDLIYEQFDLKKNKVRFVHMQYKMWEDGTLYFSDERMMGQLDKLEGHLCKSKYCDSLNENAEFRLPYCAGFLRPTNKMQNADSKLMTSGIHVPICFIQQIKETEKKLTRKNSAENSISSKVFEELFHSNMIGSRWISIDELEMFYEKKGIASLTNSIRVHAQEVTIVTDEEKYVKKD